MARSGDGDGDGAAVPEPDTAPHQPALSTFFTLHIHPDNGAVAGTGGPGETGGEADSEVEPELLRLNKCLMKTNNLSEVNKSK